MINSSWRKGALGIAVSAALAVGASNAYADNAAGSIFGQAKSGDVITIVNKDTGFKRQITADSAGRYNFPQLPTGNYTVSSGTESRHVVVTIGTGTSVSFDTEGAERIDVVAGRVSAIDTSSVESTTVFTSEQISNLPVAQDITNVALLAPGTVKGDTGFGNLASFGGSSVAENGYYINGFDVTNIRNFLSYANLPFDAIAQQQVKTGGYGAEYGRSLGGVINLVTKRGTNEWKGGVAAYYSPESLREHSDNVVSRNPDDIAGDARFFRYREDNERRSLTYNVSAGGALVQDRLFIYGIFEGRDGGDRDNGDASDTYDRDSSTNMSDRSPNWLVKLDWNITDDHLLELTSINNEYDTDYRYYTNPAGQYYTGEHGDLVERYSIRNGGDILIAKYTGYLTEDFTVSAMFGKLENTNAYRTGGNTSNCPTVYDSRVLGAGGVEYIGCWNENTFAEVRDPTFGPNTDERIAKRLDFDWQLGDHHIRFGLDDEEFTSGNAGEAYEGGAYYRLRYTENGTTIRGVALPAGTHFVRVRTRFTASGEYEINNSAAYIEDSWQLGDWVVYAGLRSESFDNKNGDGVSFVDAKDQIAPRFGASWDINGDGETKAFASLGRYYIPVAANTNIRASAAEQSTEHWYVYDGVIDPVTGAPVTLGAPIGTLAVNGSLDAPNPATVATTNLDPMYQDELIVGMQQAIAENWTVGVRGIYRDVKNGMDDYCSHQPFVDWAEDNGYTNFDSDSMASCFIMNPGQDVSLAMDLQNDGNYVEATVDSSYFGLPDYKRTYKALELFWERAGNDGFTLQGSYTLAKSEGNVEGYVNSTLEQADPGLTQDFDHALFEHGSTGPLPNDRRHTIKLFGAYQLTDELAVSGSFLAQSGRPVSCNGYIPLDDTGVDEGGLTAYSASSFYCRDEAGVSHLTQRGDYGRTPWVYNFDAGIQYVPQWADSNLTLRMDIFNVFNLQEVTEYSETGDLGRAETTQEPNFLNDSNYQAPRSARISVRYSF